MTKATLLLFNTERLIDLCPLTRVLEHNLLSSWTIRVQQILQKRQTKRKLKHYLKNTNNTNKSLNGGQKMSVGVFPFMLQLLVYVREKYKN